MQTVGSPASVSRRRMQPAQRGASGLPEPASQGNERAVAQDDPLQDREAHRLGEKPPTEVEYLLTPFGRPFMRILEEVLRRQEAIDDGVLRAW
jgi:hypothetical protein